MNNLIQIGILGCGEMGRRLAQAVNASGLGRVTLVFDSNPVKGQALAQACQAEFASSYEALLENANLQAVIIALPPFLHCESVLSAARAGKHIFLEKPMAFDLASCQQMNEAVNTAGRTLMVGHVLRYYEPFRTIVQWTQVGRFGRPLRGSFARFENSYLQLAPWKRQRALSGGYLYEIGAHGLDWLRCLFGEPEAVQARVQKNSPSDHDIEDFVSVDIRFTSEAVGNFQGGTLFSASVHSFILQFEKATLRSDDAFDPAALKIDWHDGRKPDSASVIFGHADPLEAEISDWLMALVHGTAIPIPGEDASKTVALIEAAYKYAGWA